MEPTNNKSGIGSIIATIIIIAIIILGGLYFWGKRVEESQSAQNMVNDTTAQATATQSEAAAIRTVTPADDLNSIDADLQATKLDNLGAEVNTQ